MYSRRSLCVILLALISLGLPIAGCSASPTALPTQKAPPVTVITAEAVPTTVSAAATPAPADTVEPTLAPSDTPVLIPTLAPTIQPSVNNARPSATTAPVTTGGGITRVKIFLIAVNDNGKTGTAVGCGDSVVGVEREIAPTSAPLTAALNQLFSLHDQFYGQSGLYNSLYRAQLQLSSVAIVNGRATIKLNGQLLLGGECDDPRAEAQLTQTALQFSTVHAVDIFVNGVPLKTLLSGR